MLFDDYVIMPYVLLILVQGGKEAQNALSCRSLSAKEPLILRLFCGKIPPSTDTSSLLLK